MSDDDERDHVDYMVPIEDARHYVLDAVAALKPEHRSPHDAVGLVLAEAIISDIELPRFTNSAMDGYAVHAADTESGSVTLRVVGAVMAGENPSFAVGPGQAARIMTGAPVPDGADAVCMVEFTRDGDEPGTIVIEPALRVRENVRRQGEDVAIGAEIFAAGTTITPAHLGVLESLGRSDVRVWPRPRVGVVSTGDELVHGPGPVARGKIRDANRPGMLAQLTADGYAVVDLGSVPDDLDAITELLQSAEDRCEAIVASGGVSVGDRDFVREALEKIGGEQMRWMQIAVKPAKPFAFGVLSGTGTPLFGLPGNPVSALISYELFVRPSLRAMSGHADLYRPRFAGIADADLRRKRDGKIHLVRVHATLGDDGRLHVRSAGGQDSHMLRALADANALAFVPDGDGVAAGDTVEVWLLDADRLGDVEHSTAG